MLAVSGWMGNKIHFPKAGMFGNTKAVDYYQIACDKCTLALDFTRSLHEVGGEKAL
jgi:hypothetical protein